MRLHRSELKIVRFGAEHSCRTWHRSARRPSARTEQPESVGIHRAVLQTGPSLLLTFRRATGCRRNSLQRPLKTRRQRRHNAEGCDGYLLCKRIAELIVGAFRGSSSADLPQALLGAGISLTLRRWSQRAREKERTPQSAADAAVRLRAP